METKKILSIDKPYLEHFNEFDFDESKMYKTATEFIIDSAKEHYSDYYSLPAFKFYGRQINNKELFDNINITGNALLNLGVKTDDTISMFGLNVPETYYTMYGANDMGIATEWFNPSAVTPEMLRKHIKENDVKTMVIIDVMYPIVKEAIKGTDVETVIVTSLQDSFPRKMNLLYGVQVFGLNYIYQNPYYKHVLENIVKSMPSDKELFSLSIDEQRKILKKYQQIFLKLDNYIKREKIDKKASFYTDENRDSRFILWNDFIKEYGEKNNSRREKFDAEKPKFIVHTGGTTGPAKRIAMTDIAINAAPYQSTLMPLNFEFGDTSCQLIPPMVAFSLMGMQLSRYYQMNTTLIASYDRNEFPGIITSKDKINHFFTVPSFVTTLIDNKSLEGKDLSHVKSINHGGEGISPEDDRKIDEILRAHGSFCQNALGYGQNEEFGPFTLNIPGKDVPKAYSCCGFPLFGNDFIIVDLETGEELPYGLNEEGKPYIGELYVSGPSMMLHYIGDAAKENKNTIKYRDGKKYIDTGDQAYADEYGRLWHWTREQRIIRTQDGKIFANVIEDIIKQIPEVQECCVVKCPHPTRVAGASCHIVLKDECWYQNVNAIIDKIVKIVEEKTKEMYFYYTPSSYEFTKEKLPLTPFGKTDFRALEQEEQQLYDKNRGMILKKIRIK